MNDIYQTQIVNMLLDEIEKEQEHKQDVELYQLTNYECEWDNVSDYPVGY